MDLKNHLKTNGYDTEELYFEKLNRELIEQIKKDPLSQGSLAEVIQMSDRRKPHESEEKKAA